jgi:hypothetical protein
VVVGESLLVVATDVVQATNDKQQLQPIWRFGTFTCRERNAEMLNKVVALPEVLGKAETVLAGNGYFSAANVAACQAVAVQPLIAIGRGSSSIAERALCRPAAATEVPRAGRGDGLSVGNTGRQDALSPA